MQLMQLGLLVLLMLDADEANKQNETLSARNEEVVATLKVLDRGLQQWQREVQFQCHFRYAEGYAKSLELGVQNGIDPSLREPSQGVFEATGVFCHKSELRRFSLDYGTGPIALGREEASLKGPKAVANPSFDEVTDGKLLIRYNPWKDSNYVAVEKRKNDLRAVGIHSANMLSPLNPYPNPKFLPFNLWDLGSQMPLEQQITQAGNDEIEVRLVSKGEWRQMRRLRFLMIHSPPTLKELDELIVDPEGRELDLRVRLSSFQKCPGGWVARNVRHVYRGPNGITTVKDWVSTDLGQTLPTESDFVISIKPTTIVAGLARIPPQQDQKRLLDITKITEADLAVRRARPSSHANSSSVSWRYIVAAVMLLAMLALLLTKVLGRRILGKKG